MAERNVSGTTSGEDIVLPRNALYRDSMHSQNGCGAFIGDTPFDCIPAERNGGNHTILYIGCVTKQYSSSSERKACQLRTGVLIFNLCHVAIPWNQYEAVWVHPVSRKRWRSPGNAIIYQRSDIDSCIIRIAGGMH